MIQFTRITAFLSVLLGCCSASAQGIKPFADVLVWQASEETSAVWASVITPSPVTPSSQSSFIAMEDEFGWNAGLRTGVTIEPESDQWNLSVYWTYFPTSREAMIAPGNQIVMPELFSGFLGGDAFDFTAGSLNWGLNFNAFDLEVGRELALSDTFSFRPWIGIKGAVITQAIRATWADPDTDLLAREKVDHNFYGVGPSFGIAARWIVPSCEELSLVGSLSGAILAGRWNVTDTYHRISPATAPNTYDTFTSTLSDSSLGSVMVRYFVGIEWTHQSTYPITAHLGYELQWWANQQRLLTFQQLPMHGDLTLQGGSCGLSVCF
ncbi:Lpg1974 family pore-forming outer membrane protein [Planctomicrobium sp. SH661]|uniref:Lpg1974 family pore-forming outer membrane protein n=1 Tax=Planctomicrobium sp. SH661 TaxID=3448124 RepID=UPI003F5BA548